MKNHRIHRLWYNFIFPLSDIKVLSVEVGLLPVDLVLEILAMR